jgi:hypothetical protein
VRSFGVGGRIWGVRTKRSNPNKLVVHFFGTPQKSEPKKTRVRELQVPLRIPRFVRVLPRCLTVLGLPKTAVSSRRGKLDGRVATSYGPKAVREAASVLSLDTERKVKVVGEGCVRLRMRSCRSRHYSLFISGLRSKRSGFIIHYSFGAGAPYGRCCFLDRTEPSEI